MYRIVIAACVLLVAGSSIARDGDGECADQVVWLAPEGTCILISPDGTGPALTAARDVQGHVVDATVQVRLVGLYSGFPVNGFPPEDIWLQFDISAGTTQGCVHASNCPGGLFFADGPSNSDGWITFSQPLRGGGHSPGVCWVYLNGYPVYDADLQAFPPLAMGTVSPDIDGDLTVSLADLSLFSADYFGAYALRSDLARDGVINLADVSVLAAHYGAACQ
jgi:hypothetical protein